MSSPFKDKLIIALDVQTKKDFEQLTQNLFGHATYLKVGMELYYSLGPNVITSLNAMGFKVFLDLKIHDIPQTAMKSANAITKHGVSMINVHAAGGKDMMIAAKKGVDQALEENPNLPRPLVIAVTQLTSTDQNVLNNEVLIHRPMSEVVLHYAQMAKEAGLDGVVTSPLEINLIKNKLGSDFITVTPGIRPLGVDHDDQKRVMAPQDALSQGSDFLVIGRAITRSQNPALAFKELISTLQ